MSEPSHRHRKMADRKSAYYNELPLPKIIAPWFQWTCSFCSLAPKRRKETWWLIFRSADVLTELRTVIPSGWRHQSLHCKFMILLLNIYSIYLLFLKKKYNIFTVISDFLMIHNFGLHYMKFTFTFLRNGRVNQRWYYNPIIFLGYLKVIEGL